MRADGLAERLNRRTRLKIADTATVKEFSVMHKVRET
jgi:hypothetical protein